MTPPDFPLSAAAYIESARDYIDAALKLIECADANTAVEPVGLLTSHGLELALKAYLLETGTSPSLLRRKKVRHNLCALWDMAVGHGLPIEAEPPYWLQVLNYSHDSPYWSRYRPEGVAIAIPHLSDLAEELRRVLAVVEPRVARP